MNKTLLNSKIKEHLSTAVFYFSILFFIIGFNFSDTAVNGWYQQFMPNLGGRTISDVFFLDSLTGWAVTPYRFQNDTAYVLKTTNRGDNWFISNSRIGQFVGYNKVYFLNSNTGFVCGVYQTIGYKSLSKTTDGGFNWISLNPPNATFNDMSILNETTIWLAASESLIGGVFRTTDGGLNWDRQIALGSDNPNHIYMYNERIGFIAKNGDYLRRTTNGGINWNPDTTGSGSGFTDMYFVDSLTGWKTYFSIKKTTNGGVNWITQTLPTGGIIQTSGISSFSNINRDTIWGNGGYVLYPNNQVRGLLHRTTNGGDTWLFQIPDTSIHIGSYGFCDFVNRLNGWAYVGIHTTTGGDPVFYTLSTQISSTVPKEFTLFQNYPNPFNPSTTIKFEIKSTAYIKIAVFDITGKELEILMDKECKTGYYEVKFEGKNISSGTYFYTLFADGKLIDTKAMVLIK